MVYGAEGRMIEPKLPAGYYLELDAPDLLILLRHDGSRVAVFNAWSCAEEAVEETAEADARG